MLEFLFDTTRAVVDLVLNGTVATHPGIEFVIPHGGATLPMVADRVSVFSMLLGVDPAVDVLRDLGRLHFDLAGYPLPRQLDALLTLTTIDHLHYGSDYPFTPEFAAAAAGERLAAAGEPPGSLVEALVANTQRLFPDVPSAPTSADPDPRGTHMEHQIELGYLVLELPDPDAPHAGAGRRRRPRARRSDRDRGRHLAQRPTGPARSSCSRARPTTRWPSASRRSTSTRFDADRGPAAGHRGRGRRRNRRRGRRPRRVDRLARTTAPWGSTSRSSWASRTAATPFESPLVPGGFLTEGVGFGHAVFATHGLRRRPAGSSSTASASASPTGSRPSWRRASRSRCASTTATSGTTPSRSPWRRSSCRSGCTTSCSRRRSATTSAPPSTGCGPPTWPSPTGSAATTTTACSASTCRPRPASRSRSATAPRSITDDWDDNRRYDRISAWGHQPLRQA